MKICVFGDSIAYGAYDPVNGGWVTLLRNYLEEKYEGEVLTYNLGVCGETSEDLVKRFKNEAVIRKPDLIVFAIGANDVKHQKNIEVPFKLFEKNINFLVTQAKEITDKIVFLGVTPVDEKFTTPRDKPPYNFRENKDIDRLNKILKEICLEEKLVFVLVEGMLVDDLDDGLHPNTNGHKKIFGIVRPVVDNLVS